MEVDMYDLVCMPVKSIVLKFLETINLNPDDVPRLRDAWANKDFTTVTVYTRTGGGNRVAYAAENLALTKHPLYISDVDCDIDSTYAKFTFSMPEEQKAAMIQDILTFVPDEEERTKILELLTTEAGEKWERAFIGLGVEKPQKQNS